MGYTNVGHYKGGIEEWLAHGEPVEAGPVAAPRRAGWRQGLSSADRNRLLRLRPASSPVAWIERLASWSYVTLLGLWVGMVLGMGFLYWTAIRSGHGTLLEAGRAVAADWHGLRTAVYFSMVTATSVGFGDVVPVGTLRLLAVLEGASGLLVFGIIVSKLVSRRQEELAEDTHRIAFEERLGRVRTNLHLVLSELQAIAMDQHAAANATVSEQMLSRLESAAMMLSGELRTVHDLLYRTQEQPEEPVVEGLLANLSANLGELRMLLEQLPGARRRSHLLDETLGVIGTSAAEICGECVPREYAGHLKVWMDRIQDLSRGFLPPG